MAPSGHLRSAGRIVPSFLSRLRGRAVQTLSPDSRNRVWGFFLHVKDLSSRAQLPELQCGSLQRSVGICSGLAECPSLTLSPINPSVLCLTPFQPAPHVATHEDPADGYTWPASHPPSAAKLPAVCRNKARRHYCQDPAGKWTR
jgi:hypothetical protein